MNDFDEMVSNMLTWSDDHIKAEELDCNLTINYPSATDADKNEARQVLRAIYEARNLRKKIAAARDKWDEMQEGERLARIELYKDEAKAAMQAERGTQQPQRAAANEGADRKKDEAKEAIKAVLINGLLAHADEFFRIVSQKAHTRGSKRAAAAILAATYEHAVNHNSVTSLAAWFDMWAPLTGIKGNDPNYRNNKLDLKFESVKAFSPDVQRIIVPEAFQ